MKKKLKTLNSVTVNGGTIPLPKPVKIDTERYNDGLGLLFEILRKECEALTGEKIPVVYEMKETEAEPVN